MGKPIEFAQAWVPFNWKLAGKSLLVESSGVPIDLFGRRRRVFWRVEVLDC